jgi:histidine triad (HIT) family protein
MRLNLGVRPFSLSSRWRASMEQCIFCEIACRRLPAVTVYEDPEILAFLDHSPIRRGHTQIIPRQHFDTFEQLPAALAGRILSLGQRLALRLKELYEVERVAFAFTGGDVAHAHAHVVPIHEKGDITSTRYKLTPDIESGSEHLRMSFDELSEVRDEIGPVAPLH